MPHALSEREKEYLEFLRDYVRENEYTPQLKEVADHFGVSNETLRRWEKQGLIPMPTRINLNKWRTWSERDLKKIETVIKERST